MISLTFSPALLTSSSFRSPKLLSYPHLQSRLALHGLNGWESKHIKRKKRCGICKAELSLDAPFAVAIGACILNSLIFPISDDSLQNGDDGDSAIDSTDARFAVMAVLSFIPYFNWLSWIFAWLDTGKQRYLVYSIVYLAPYIRTNLSLSPEESWLPIASIVLGIIHIQLEGSIRNGDIEPLNIFGNAPKVRPPLNRKKESDPYEHHGNFDKGRDGGRRLPSAIEKLQTRIRGFGIPKKHVDDSVHLNDDENNK
ncbi:hypothetical protein H6P81_005523 [Aristolochia fimbriata]|uniref:Uncharacterized protein n=1 Tax=Aristolochia fimbriata TaxID=158543 RepID=A0AAV7EW49_ARIFI|nr:hypothetical protein H6P81_005523 [Aristolochia fimbriata]